MSPNRRIGIALAVLALLTLALWWSFTPPTPGAAAPKLPTAASPSGAPARPKGAASSQAGPRTRVPRRIVRNVAPTAVPTPSAPEAPVAAAAPTPPPRAPDGPIDRRENPPGDAAATGAAIRSRVMQIDAALTDCLDGWRELDPQVGTGVGLAFQFDPDGLEDVWVLDHADVPAGPLDCFADAVDTVDWAGVSSEPLEVSLRFGEEAAAP